MGCVSSKPFKHNDLVDGDLSPTKKKRKNTTCNNSRKSSAAPPTLNHIVSLTSSTYGVLNLDRDEDKNWEDELEIVKVEVEPVEAKKECTKHSSPVKSSDASVKLEVINAWDLMRDLDVPIWSPAKKPGIHSTPAKAVKKSKWFSPKGKEKENSPLRSSEKSVSTGRNRKKRSPLSAVENTPVARTVSPSHRKNMSVDSKIRKSDRDSRISLSRRSSSPLFDPELLAAIEREFSQEKEQVKKIVDRATQINRNRLKDSAALLQTFEEKCPPGGSNTVILYTTTLRGIRKTFDDCNKVRSAIEALDIRFIERDISMDSGFREELRLLSGKKETKVPLLFVKGRLIGGADEVLRLEDEGKLGLLMDGMPRAAAAWCDGCGGVRFVMCVQCRGSCKVVDEGGKSSARCAKCNENGLIHCPLCCS